LLSTQCAHHKPKPDDLPPLSVDPFVGLDALGEDEEQRFTFREGPRPPADVSERVKLPFPPPESPGKVKKPRAPALRVLRYQPTGKEGLIGAVTATFNQPMVPVATLDELRAHDPPLTISPRVEGRFRWLGTRTVTFEPRGRMPFGTRFVARVPAGTRAISGKRLERETRWEFSTPRPKLVRALPPRRNRQVKPDTALAFLFNQPVDGKHLLDHLTVNKLGKGDLELVPRDRWSKLKRIGEAVATWDADRTVVVQPRSRLTLATSYRVKLRAGLKGEGPLGTKRDQYHYFSTYSPLRVEAIRCASYSRCDPDYGLVVRFNNPLVTTADELTKHLGVAPAPADMEVSGSGTYFYLKGSFKPRSKVTVSVERGPKDVHDQALSRPEKKTVTLGDLNPGLTFPAYGHAVIERRGNRKVPLTVSSVTAARMRLVRVRREQLLKVIEKARYSYDDDGRKDPLKGIKGIVVTRNLRTGVAINKRGTVGISTDEGLGRGAPGVLYIELRSDELKRFSKYANRFRGLVVSVTDIGLMARYDHDRIIVLATNLTSGKPLGRAKLELRDREGKVLWSGRAEKDGTAVLPGRRELKGRPPYVIWGARGRDQTFLKLEARDVASHWIYSYSTWGSPPPKKRPKMFLFTDRNPYRPGETVHLKGVLRQEDTGPGGGVEPLPPRITTADIRVQSPRGHKILEKKKLPLSPSGAFSVDVDIPVGADLGYYSVHVGTSIGSSNGSFRVEEYRAPEFEVKVETEDKPLFFGDTLSARVGADYLFGAPMSGAELRWTLRRQETSFRPPRNDGFSFGEALPFWFRWRYGYGRRGGRHGGYYVQSGPSGGIIARGTTTLGEDGRLTVKQKLERDTNLGKGGGANRHPRIGPASFTLEAEVVDQNRQSIANRKVLTVHPAALYIGLRPKKTVVKAGEPLKVDAVLAGLDGKRVPGKALTLRALKVVNKVTTVKEGGEWRYKWESKEVEVDSCKVTTASDPRGCDLTPKKPGAYLVRADFKDPRGRLGRTTLTVYAHGPGYVPWRLKNQSKIELVPDRESYEPGDVARVLVKSPLKQAVGFLTLSRSGMVKHEVLSMKGNAQVVEVPISDRHLPELYVGVALARGRVKDKEMGKGAQDLGRPTFAHGQVRLPVSLKQKTLTVEVKPRQKEVRPSGTLDLELRTKDSAGRPVRSELALMVVDEGVLSLMGYQTPDPISFFWHGRSPETGLMDSRNALLKRQKNLRLAAGQRRTRNGGGRRAAVQSKISLLANRAVTGAEEAEVALPAASPAPVAALERMAEKRKVAKGDFGGVVAGKRGPRIRARSFFATTAYYNPSVVTGEDGRAKLQVKMPDNLTTFRIMAVALDRGRVDRFGKGEAQVKVRKLLLLRPSLPRFLSVGDRFEAAVMVHNETKKDGTVDVLVRGRNVKARGRTRKRVKIPAGRAREVRFLMEPRSAGPARLQFAAVLGNCSPEGRAGGAKTCTDAVEKQIPVLLPATTEAFATYGMTDRSIAQQVVPPKDALPGYGGLEIAMSSTALNGLEDSVRYLVDYPYECTEQTASRILPIFALKDILKDFKIAKLGDLERQKQLAEAGVRKLLSSQRYDGGWGMWSGSRISWPYLTAYALFTLRRAEETGIKIPARNIDRAARFLKRILDQPRTEFGEQYNHTTQALSVWALTELKRYERKHAKRLYGLRKKLPLFAQVWLTQALFRMDGRSAQVKELLRHLDNQATETASAAHFAEIKTESLRLLMHSEERTDAIALYALLEVAPDHTLMPKLARGLIQSRVKGTWSTTQGNAWALTALSRYYRQVEKTVPDYVASLWLGEEGYLGQSKFKGRQMRVVQQKVPLAALKKAGKEELIISKKGAGKLYYRIGLRYAPTDLELPPEEQGFAVTRTYEPVESGATNETVRRQKDGTWRVKAGSYVRVRLTVVVPDRRYFVAVMDPLPAGLEAVNLSFKTSASSRLGGQLKGKIYDFYSWYSFFAFDHKELRDESVVIFSDRLPSGIYEYTYLARATSLGRFIAAPTKAEEMYRPETFGRSGTHVVEVR
jgi:uncharacterized protein YfaS (alpha-2-macroglobulin family)